MDWTQGEEGRGEGDEDSLSAGYTISTCPTPSCPPLAAVGVNVCQRSLKRTSGCSWLGSHRIRGKRKRRTERTAAVHVLLEFRCKE